MKLKASIVKALCGALMFLLLLSLTMPSGVCAGTGRIKITVSHTEPPGAPWALGAELFAQEMRKRLGDRVAVDIYGAEILGSEKEQLDGLVMGTIQISMHSSGVIGTIYKPVEVLNFPYLFRDQVHLHETMASPAVKALLEGLRKARGIRLLAMWDRGPRYLTSNKPINTVEDVRGLKLRVPEIASWVEAWKAIGAKPTPIAWGEVYTSLQLGVVEAQENPLEQIYTAKLYEVQKYLALTAHVHDVRWIMVNDAFYTALPNDVRTAVDESMEVATAYVNKLVADNETLLFDKLKARMTVTRPDPKEFEAKLGDVYLKVYANYPECVKLYEAIKGIKR